jgi:uncharacterized protein YutE (UPF0331/DUF86 family)
LVDREVFDRRLAKLEELLRNLRSLVGEGRDRFLSDAGLQAEAERWLQLAAESTLDLAHHLIADRGWTTPTTYRDAFLVLEQEGVIPPELARQMEGWAGLRNVLVHLYMDIDHQRLWECLTEDLDQIEDFARAMVSQLD